MKSKIIIGILVIFNVIFFIFAITQQIEAEAQREKAVQAQVESEQNAEEAVRQHEIAIEQTRIAQANADEASRMAEVANKEIKGYKVNYPIVNRYLNSSFTLCL